MVDYQREDGSSFVWFTGLLVVIVMGCLTLALSIHQYLFARQLKDFVEEYALATKTLLIQQKPLPSIKTYLDEKVLAVTAFKDMKIRELSLLDSNTVQVVGCATWNAPMALIQTNREICEVALAR